MGQANCPVAFHADADSHSGGGLQSVISEPITLLTADEFWSLLAMDLRGRTDGTLSAGDPNGFGDQLLVRHAGRIYGWLLCQDIDQAECCCFGTDSTLSRMLSRGTLKVHREPFRLEYWNLVYGQRESNEELRTAMRRILTTMRSNVSCTLNVDSPDGSGLKSVMSDPIFDSALSPDMLWKQTKNALTKKALKVLPDGGIVQKAASRWLLPSPDMYTKHVFYDASKEIVSYYYKDEKLTETSLESVRHLKVHPRPYRLEMWMAALDKRRAGNTEKQELMALLQSVLEQARLLATRPNEPADAAEIASLKQDISAFRQEVTTALSALHQGAVVLEAR